MPASKLLSDRRAAQDSMIEEFFAEKPIDSERAFANRELADSRREMVNTNAIDLDDFIEEEKDQRQ